MTDKESWERSDQYIRSVAKVMLAENTPGERDPDILECYPTCRLFVEPNHNKEKE